MKTRFILFTLIAAFCMTACNKTDSIASNPSPGRTIVVSVAPTLSEDDRAKVWKHVGALVLEGAAPGDDIRLFDGMNLREITRFTIPREQVMLKNPNARARRLKDRFNEFQQFIKAPAATDGTRPGALLEPQALELIARQLRLPGQPLTVVLIGSALYVHPRDLEWNFEPNRYPSDGHLAADSAVTPFSTRGHSDALEGVTIYHAYLHDEFPNEAYKKKLTRWWSLWAASQKGVLAEFTADLPLVIEAAIRGGTGPIQIATADENDDKVLMHEPPKAVAEILPTDTWIASDILEPAPPPVVNSIVHDLKIGIRWRDPVDMDLYARPAPDKQELYYRLSRTPEGYHQKDYVSAPPGINGFETITFTEPVDLRVATAAINFYSGSAPAGAEIEVRVSCDGHTYATFAKLSVSTGNHGSSSQRRAKDPHWAVIDFAKIVGLHPDGKTAVTANVR